MAKRTSGGKTANLVRELVQPICQELGVELWDVLYLKEGSDWFLRVVIDRPEGIDLNTCEAVSRRVSDLLDEADPIPESYFLEVSSPGIERALTRDEHFARYLGEPVRVTMIRPLDGCKELVGELVKKEGALLTLALEGGGTVEIDLAQTAKVNAVDTEEAFADSEDEDGGMEKR
ncbi:ribosome maturation factor RimP [Acetanaerobacterium sp. MSJ-12]|uniref:Ribosome maturation factor RimP n=1 Tax=Bittarella massiliensis (ex Durand et al. 2017) TaxID=1720313 RepID=A0AAW5KC56_9FIRM|nr:ribosome maturation factor RimP [Bittarella massiliensis (ex Durand et al. 2017)]MBU5418995.1 ribosome maturation factor RimP [Acetanaerobacterium sp. MSJ-12]MCB5940035.1 ribosome maturation factor RimP [bacterium 210820-DFI.6.52]MCQ4949605.1 ribosome maturation factor RimP [Bittarella massiliensis (ex Durand et al. 2017)]